MLHCFSLQLSFNSLVLVVVLIDLDLHADLVVFPNLLALQSTFALDASLVKFDHVEITSDFFDPGH